MTGGKKGQAASKSATKPKKNNNLEQTLEAVASAVATSTEHKSTQDDSQRSGRSKSVGPKTRSASASSKGTVPFDPQFDASTLQAIKNSLTDAKQSSPSTPPAPSSVPPPSAATPAPAAVPTQCTPVSPLAPVSADSIGSALAALSGYLSSAKLQPPAQQRKHQPKEQESDESSEEQETASASSSDSDDQHNDTLSPSAQCQRPACAIGSDTSSLSPHPAPS